MEHLRENWMRVVMDSGLADHLGKVMQEDPGCHSLTLLPKQSKQCTLVGHDMAHWPAMVKSWGVLVSSPPALQHIRHMPGIYQAYASTTAENSCRYARHMLGICLIQEGKNTPPKPQPNQMPLSA